VPEPRQQVEGSVGGELGYLPGPLRRGLHVLAEADDVQRHVALRQALGGVVLQAGLPLGGELLAVAFGEVVGDYAAELLPEFVIAQRAGRKA